MNKKAFFVAGGTAGHINTAIEVGEQFKDNGHEIKFLTGRRHLDYKLFNNKDAEYLNAKPLMVASPAQLIKNIFHNMLLFIQVWFLIRKEKPTFVFGAGGYVCGPVLAAAHFQKIPVFILEQNSVFGLTNKILAKIADKVFISFKDTKGIEDKFKSKIVFTGNPIRKEFFSMNFNKTDDVYTILVFGGSLGAKEINELVIEFAQRDSLRPIRIIHQVGKAHESKEVKAGENINYIQYEYLDNILDNYKDANLIICRSGASTLSELKVVGKPAVLIPLLVHKDKHQVHNANGLKTEQDNIWVSSTKELKEYEYRLMHEIIDKTYELEYKSDSKFENPLNHVVKEIIDHVYK